MKLVELQNISLKIEGKSILENISLSLARGSITTLIGVNGGGKTSISKIIIGAIKASSGNIIRNIVKGSKLKIGYMPQHIYTDKTIPLDVLNFIKILNPKLICDDKFYSWCARLKIDKILNHQIHDISGGQLQKALFLQAICDDNDLLILDEPTQFMDFSAVNEFYKIVDEIRCQSKCAVLMTSHDLHLVMQKTDIVYCINRHICCFGKPEDINQHPEYLMLFGERANNQLNEQSLNCNHQKQVEKIIENSQTEISFYTHHHNHKH